MSLWHDGKSQQILPRLHGKLSLEYTALSVQSKSVEHSLPKQMVTVSDQARLVPSSESLVYIHRVCPSRPWHIQARNNRQNENSHNEASHETQHTIYDRSRERSRNDYCLLMPSADFFRRKLLPKWLNLEFSTSFRARFSCFNKTAHIMAF